MVWRQAFEQTAVQIGLKREAETAGIVVTDSQIDKALVNNADMFEAWNNVGYVHLQLGAYAESVDDYNHTLALKPDLLEAIEYRAEAYLGVDRLEDAKSAYMDLFNHDRPLADQLMLLHHRFIGKGICHNNGFEMCLTHPTRIARGTAMQMALIQYFQIAGLKSITEFLL